MPYRATLVATWTLTQATDPTWIVDLFNQWMDTYRSHPYVRLENPTPFYQGTQVAGYHWFGYLHVPSPSEQQVARQLFENLSRSWTWFVSQRLDQVTWPTIGYNVGWVEVN